MIEIMNMTDDIHLEILPPDKPVNVWKWVFNIIKETRYKARLVALGFMQNEGLDYRELFSCNKYTSFMLDFTWFLWLILIEDLNAFVLDAKISFLNFKLNETVLMDQTQGYDHKRARKCKIKKKFIPSKTICATIVWNVYWISFKIEF